jgi:phosphatidylinositol-3,4,5-trisphosphate 3-phosphatase and dual-specificity protein phosphatase PTEN
VHCNSGKGRTGTAICAIMLYLGFFDNIDDTLKYYGHQRFICGKGVSQPCQLRYLYYFEGYYKKQIKSPSCKRLRSIQFVGVPNVSGGGCQPCFDVYDCQGMNITKIFSYQSDKFYTSKKDGGVYMGLTEQQRNSFVMRDNAKIIFYHQGTMQQAIICRIMFNTAFIQNGNYICAGKMQLSPEDIRKSNVLSNKFLVYVVFDDYCKDCNSYRTEIENLCENCKEGLGPQVLKEWQEVK